MQTNDTGRSMNQLIFQLGLPTETVSVYLLCCGLSDEGLVVTRRELAKIWNGDAQMLDEGISDLVDRNIVRRGGSDQGSVLEVNPVGQWRHRSAG